MKKIYFLHEHPTKLGNVIEYRGFRATVTEDLIELNPELFTVKDTMQELLDEAKRRYPPGTRYISFNEHKISNKEDLPLVVSEIGIPHINHYEFDNTSIYIDSGKYNGVVYADGKWAEILPLKFTTEDGVDIYGDMKTYLINPNDSFDICFYHNLWNGDSKRKSNKYFYHKENALAYIEKHKEKTLEEYENNLFEIMQTNVYSSNNRHYFSVWSWIKDNEPKLYYTKILQLIADDLNDGWVADFTNHDGKKWFITKEEVDFNYHIIIQSVAYFKSRDLAQKARNILRNKVKYLFN